MYKIKEIQHLFTQTLKYSANGLSPIHAHLMEVKDIEVGTWQDELDHGDIG